MCFFNDLINVSQTWSCLSSDHDGKCSAIRSRVGLNWQILIKKGHFKIIVLIKSLLTNYIIQCRLREGSNERAGTPCMQMVGVSVGVHTLSGSLVPPIFWLIHPALAPTDSYSDHNHILAWWPPCPFLGGNQQGHRTDSSGCGNWQYALYMLWIKHAKRYMHIQYTQILFPVLKRPQRINITKGAKGISHSIRINLTRHANSTTKKLWKGGKGEPVMCSTCGYYHTYTAYTINIKE